MDIEQYDLLTIEKIFCPSKGETIYSVQEVNYESEAVIACWFTLEEEEPIIKDKKLSDAWHAFYNSYHRDTYFWEDFRNFLRKSCKTEWKILEVNDDDGAGPTPHGKLPVQHGAGSTPNGKSPVQCGEGPTLNG